MDTFGDQLRQERERRNVALDEIARLTKIRMRYLQALEDGQHERLPGIVFAKGYVRAYAETIGADADRLVGAYVAEQRSLGRLETEASQENVLEALAAAVETDKEIAEKRSKLALIAGALVIVAAVGFWFGVRPLLQQEPAPIATTPPATPVAGQAEAADGVDVIPVDPEPIAAPLDDEASSPVSPPETVETLPAEPVVTEAEPVPVPTEAEPARVEPEAVVAKTEPQPLTANEDMSVSEYGVGTDVRQRVLVGEASEFETGTMVVFWNRVVGGEPGRHIRHVWFHEGSVNGVRELSIGAAHWRTYSKQTLRRGGLWTVEAQDEQGRVLARETFVATSRKL